MVNQIGLVRTRIETPSRNLDDAAVAKAAGNLNQGLIGTAGGEEAGGTEMSAMRFARIELKNWRNFSTVDVALARRVFIVGPNPKGVRRLHTFLPAPRC
jgi:hypothetical protein